MAVLAVGALVAGGLLGPTGKISEYLSKTPLLHPHEHAEPMWLLVASSIIALAGIFVGYTISQKPAPAAGLLKSLADFGRNRLYIDWLYNVAIVQPMLSIAQFLEWIDTNIIGAVTDAIAGLPRLLGMAGQRLQTGRVPAYSLLTALGIAAVAIWIVTRASW
jgi:NADH:ubiquinone oxidoreductase subunit 5 (subunit L)/multisubunit Na+/H+ antiporter MnhA subunit